MNKTAVAVEKRTKVKPIKVDLTCGKCGGIFERNSDIVLTTYPPQYSYKCNKCGEIITTSDIFPKIEYEEIETINIPNQEEKEPMKTFNEIMAGKFFSHDVALKILNFYRNYYHAEDNNTVEGILAHAINEILPIYCMLAKIDLEQIKGD